MRIALAAPHTSALDAADEVARRGGGVVDATVAAAASLTVVYPHMCSVGGDLIALIRTPDGVPICLNASGAYGSGGTTRRLLVAGGRMPLHGPAVVTVPGAVAGWQSLLESGGTLPVADVLAPAIEQAAAGVPVSPGVASSLRSHRARLLADPGIRAVFAPGGHALQAGERLRQPTLATTLQQLAVDGLRSLYDGPLAARLRTGLERLGVPVTAADLAAHRVEECAPLLGEHRGARVLTAPPNSQGYLLLSTLAALDLLDAPEPDAGLLAQVFAAADAQRDLELGDPASMTADVVTLVSSVRGRELLDRARTLLVAGGPVRRTGPVPDGDTVAVTTVGDDGTAVCLVQSNFNAFGSGMLEPDTGLVLHNRGCSFSLVPGHPNLLHRASGPLTR